MRTFGKSFWGAFIVLACMVFGAVWCAAPKTSVFADTAVKTYAYTIVGQNRQFQISAKYADGTTYALSTSATLKSAMQKIDEDRLIGETHNPATITLQNLVVGDEYLPLQFGSYAINGTLLGRTFSTFGLVYVTGDASVTFDATLTNEGQSYLIKNTASGKLRFDGGKYKANQQIIYSSGNGNIEILGGTFMAKSAVAIESVASADNVVLSVANNACIKISSSNSAAIFAQNTYVNILGGMLVGGSNAPIIQAQGKPVTLSGTPILSGGNADIATDCKTKAAFSGQQYEGRQVKIRFDGEIISGQTACVEQGDLTKFIIMNQHKTLKKVNGDLVIFDTFELKYCDPKGLAATLPSELDEFVADEIVELKFLTNANLKPTTIKRYEFLGWSLTENATTPVYTTQNKNLRFGQQNVRLYAVWRACQYTITYIGVQGATNINPNTYKSDAALQIAAPSKPYYDFVGWSVNGQSKIVSNFEIAKNSCENFELTAHWRLSTYKIAYPNLAANVIEDLGLLTEYNIEMQAYEIDKINMLHSGYAFFGVFFDPEETVVCNQKIFFELDKQAQNSANFLSTNTIGEQINIYVALRPYFNGTGQGTQSQPYLLDSTSQFLALITGEKQVSNAPVYVDMIRHITLPSFEEDEYTGLVGVILNGNQHTLTINQNLQNQEKIFALPHLTGCTLKNLVIATKPLSSNVVNGDLTYAALADSMQNCTLCDVQVIAQSGLNIASYNTAGTIKLGGIATLAENCTFQRVNVQMRNTCNFGVVNADLNLYAAALVGFGSDKCQFFNISANHDLVLAVAGGGADVCVYGAGIALLGQDNNIINANCLFDASVNYPAARGHVAGVCVPFGSGNKVENTLGILQSDMHQDCVVQVQDLCAKLESVNIKNSFAAADLSADASGVCQKLNKSLNSVQKQTSAVPQVWVLEENAPVLRDGVIVRVFGNGIAPNQYKFFENAALANRYVPYFDLSSYYFTGFTDSKGQKTVFDGSAAYVETTANFASYQQMIYNGQCSAVIAAALVLLATLIVLYLIDKKKPVSFVKNGQVVSVVRVARTKKVPLPDDFVGKIAFLDAEGTRPFLKQKMPFHALTLYVFDGEKQARKEEFWRVKFATEQEAKQQKQNKKLARAQSKAEKFNKKQAQKIAQHKAQLRQRKKMQQKSGLSKKSSSKKVVRGAGGKVIIIKKEIKSTHSHTQPKE